MAMRNVCACVFFTLFTALLHGQQAWIVTSTELKSAPDYTAKTLTQLKEEQPVNISARQGGWYEVVTPLNQKGWVRIVVVRLNADQTADYGSAISSWMNLGSNDSSAVATGVRGLSDEGAEGAEGEASLSMHRLKSYHVAPDVARQFAQEAGLKPKRVNYVEVE